VKSAAKKMSLKKGPGDGKGDGSRESIENVSLRLQFFLYSVFIIDDNNFNKNFL
jgi:hypothetical protein